MLTNDPAKAREEQHEAFLKVMSNERGPEYLETVYLFGTPDEIVASLQARVDAGVEYFFLHTMTPDPAQLQQWVDEIIPNVDLPADRRAGASAADAVAAMTRRVALLGKPLKRRHSQVMHNAAFDAAGIDARYELRELEPDEVEAVGRGGARARLPGPRRDGAVQAGRRRAVDEVEPDASEIGAVNNVVRTDDGRLVGFNTDAPGFLAGAELAMGFPLAARRSSSRAPAARPGRSSTRASKAGVDRVTVGSRDQAAAAALAARTHPSLLSGSTP